jgi:hypothetical protein
MESQDVMQSINYYYYFIENTVLFLVRDEPLSNSFIPMTFSI